MKQAIKDLLELINNIGCKVSYTYITCIWMDTLYVLENKYNTWFFVDECGKTLGCYESKEEAILAELGDFASTVKYQDLVLTLENYKLFI